jgi:hypothetical protein
MRSISVKSASWSSLRASLGKETKRALTTGGLPRVKQPQSTIDGGHSGASRLRESLLLPLRRSATAAAHDSATGCGEYGYSPFYAIRSSAFIAPASTRCLRCSRKNATTICHAAGVGEPFTSLGRKARTISATGTAVRKFGERANVPIRVGG